MRSKARTIQERFGFSDPDLTTPQHDKIICWLSANTQEILSGLFPPEWTVAETKLLSATVEAARNAWYERFKTGAGLDQETARQVRILAADIDHWHRLQNPGMEQASKNKLEDFRQTLAAHWPDPGAPPPREAYTISSTHIEFPIMNGNYVIGFVDFVAKVQKPRLYLSDVNSVGQWAPTWRTSRERASLLFEVKTAINSLGELLRQINLYRAYETQSQFIVVSPDDHFRSQIESENIAFVKYVG